MIEVELPDGSIAEFPDGTSPDVIKGALQKRFAAQPAPKAGRVPEERGFLRRVDDAVRGVADMATFGLADEFAAKMGDLTGIGGNAGQYEQNLARQRQRDAQGGYERLGGQLAGAIITPGLGAAKTVGGAAAQGAGLGAAYGFGSGEGGLNERLQSAAAGGAVGGVAGGVVRGVTSRLGERAAAAAIPTTDDLRKAGQAAYEAADKAGVIIRPESTARLSQAIKADLAEFGFDPALQPGVSAVINRLDGLEGQNVTLKGLDIIRRVANNAGQVRDNPSQKALVGKITGKIDDFISELKPSDVLAGDAKGAANSMLKARNLWGRLRRAEMADTAVLKAERRAASTGSGGNADNAVRQNIRSLLDNPKTARGMTETEKKAAERVVRGTVPQNALRLAGKLAPTGVVSGALSSGLGYGLAGPVGIALPVAGQAAKSAADAMTMRNVAKLSEIIRGGGMSAAERAAAMRSGALPASQELLRIEAINRALQNPLARMATIPVGQR